MWRWGWRTRRRWRWRRRWCRQRRGSFEHSASDAARADATPDRDAGERALRASGALGQRQALRRAGVRCFGFVLRALVRCCRGPLLLVDGRCGQCAVRAWERRCVLAPLSLTRASYPPPPPALRRRYPLTLCSLTRSALSLALRRRSLCAATRSAPPLPSDPLLSHRLCAATL
jgi:hypothetical protein